MLSTNQLLLGIGLVLVLAVGSQLLARTLQVPAIVVLLPVGFVAGILTKDVQPSHLLGPLYQPFVSVAVGVVLFEAGLRLSFREVTPRIRPVVVRLVSIGLLLTWLAVLREWTQLDTLVQVLHPRVLRVQTLEALEALSRRSLVERGQQVSFGLESPATARFASKVVALAMERNSFKVFICLRSGQQNNAPHNYYSQGLTLLVDAKFICCARPVLRHFRSVQCNRPPGSRRPIRSDSWCRRLDRFDRSSNRPNARPLPGPGSGPGAACSGKRA